MMMADAICPEKTPRPWDTILNTDYKEKNDMMRWLLSNGSNINAQTKFGTTALLRAVHQTSAGAVKLLLRKGANPNLRDAEEGTPLTLDNRLKSKFTNTKLDEIARLLQESGARE